MQTGSADDDQPTPDQLRDLVLDLMADLVRDEAHGSFVHVYMAGAGGTVMLSADSWQEGYEDLVVGPRDPPVEVLGTVVWWQAYEDVTR